MIRTPTRIVHAFPRIATWLPAVNLRGASVEKCKFSVSCTVAQGTAALCILWLYDIIWILFCICINCRILEIVEDVLNVVKVALDDPFEFAAPNFGVRVEDPPEDLGEEESYSPNLEALLSQVMSSTTRNMMKMPDVPPAAVTLSLTLLQPDDMGNRPRISTSIFARDSLFRQRDSFNRRNNRTTTEIVGSIVIDLTLRTNRGVQTVFRPPNSNVVRPRFTKSLVRLS